MKYLQFTLCLINLLLIRCLPAYAKNEVTDADKQCLEGIIVERYYVADASDYADTTGGVLPGGSVTYRIYVDMKSGYRLQAVYGDKNHQLRIQTTTTFFNNTQLLAVNGGQVHPKDINLNTFALDSWLSMGAATREHAGILMKDDHDGSIIKRTTLSKQDGLTNGNLPIFKSFGLDLGFFNRNDDDSLFITNNGGWAAISGSVGGTKGPTDDNRVLIAQLTTNGKLSFRLNVQVGTPDGKTLKFVAENPGQDEILFTGLTYPN